MSGQIDPGQAMGGRRSFRLDAMASAIPMPAGHRLKAVDGMAGRDMLCPVCHGQSACRRLGREVDLEPAAAGALTGTGWGGATAETGSFWATTWFRRRCGPSTASPGGRAAIDQRHELARSRRETTVGVGRGLARGIGLQCGAGIGPPGRRPDGRLDPAGARRCGPSDGLCSVDADRAALGGHLGRRRRFRGGLRRVWRDHGVCRRWRGSALPWGMEPICHRAAVWSATVLAVHLLATYACGSIARRRAEAYTEWNV